MGTLLALLLLSAARAQVPEVGAPVPVDDPAAAAFSAKLSFEGTAEERLLFEALVRRILESPPHRELAAAFSAGQGKVSTRFQEMPGTNVYERREGRTAFDAKHAAHVIRGQDEAVIELNRACLEIDPEYALEQCSGQLVHEALGHTLGWLEAGPAGVRAAYVYYDDELWARMTQWALAAETGRRVLDPEAWCALGDPEAFQRHLARTYSSSIDALAHPSEIGDVVRSPVGPALAARAAMVRARLRGMPESFFAVDDCSDYLEP